MDIGNICGAGSKVLALGEFYGGTLRAHDQHDTFVAAVALGVGAGQRGNLQCAIV
jgi:hypothetical protein